VSRGKLLPAVIIHQGMHDRGRVLPRGVYLGGLVPGWFPLPQCDVDRGVLGRELLPLGVDRRDAVRGGIVLRDAQDTGRVQYSRRVLPGRQYVAGHVPRRQLLRECYVGAGLHNPRGVLRRRGDR